MTTVIDSNVLIELWDPDQASHNQARNSLDAALAQGGLVVPAPVFAELMAAPGRTEAFLNTFFQDTSIRVDWELGERVWRVAGRAFRDYAARRRSLDGPRRILADFLIGAYAMQNGYQLLTLDRRLYRAAFPELKIASAT